MKIIKTRICITGHNGFIGKNLLKILETDTNIELILFKGDLLKEKDVELFFSNNPKIDQIIYLVGGFFGSFEQLIKINAVALDNLLRISTLNRVKKIIFTSTGAVYGEPSRKSSREDDLLRPNTPYGLSKMFAEEIIKYYNQNFGLNYIILRFSNVYGEGSNKGVLYNFISGIKTKGVIFLDGDGKQTRNFLHVSDACLAIKKSIIFNQSGIFNISSSIRYSLIDIVKVLQKRYRFKVEFRKADNTLKDLSLDINKSKKILGFNTIEEEINFENLDILYCPKN